MLVGYISGHQERDVVAITAQAVLPTYQRMTMGTLLLDHLCMLLADSSVRSLSIDLSAYTEAVPFYTGYGFEAGDNNVYTYTLNQQ